MKKERIVIALGGNALETKETSPTAKEQLKTVERTVKYIADIILEGYEVILAHGNGPQVGRIVLQNEAADDITPALPFDVCGAMSQGYIGYHIQQQLRNEFEERGINKSIATIITQVVVNENDSAFKNPTKPIGPFYDEKEAKMFMKNKGYIMKEDAGRGYRRVVASPKPIEIVELDTIKLMVKNNFIVIAVGGGGIPVIKNENNKLSGIAAVIDKDLAASKLAMDLDADVLLILTEVEKVALNYKTPDEKWIDSMDVSEIQKFIKEKQFAEGSMLPKVLAAVEFVKGRADKRSIITSLDGALMALEGVTGTTIIDKRKS